MLKELQNELTKIQKGEIRRYYILLGDDDYLLGDALKRLLEALLPHSDKDFGIASFDCDTANEQDILDALHNEPLLPVQHIIVLKNFALFKNKVRSASNSKKFFDLLESEPRKAAREFCRILASFGYSPEIMKDEQWRQIEDDEWEKMMDARINKNILEQMAHIVAQDDFSAPSDRNDHALLVNALQTQYSPTRTVIFTAANLDKSNKLLKALGYAALLLHFEKPKIEAQQKIILMETAQEALAQEGKKISPAALDAIGKKVGFESANVMAAVRKLAAYIGNKKNIEETDVEAAIGRTKEEAVFELSTAMARKNLGRALLLLGEILDRGEHHQVVHAVIAREVRLLLHAKTMLMTKKIAGFEKGMNYADFIQRVFPKIKSIAHELDEDLLSSHPYTAYLAFQNSLSFSDELLVKFLERISLVDIAFKSSPRNPRLALEQFIIGFCAS